MSGACQDTGSIYYCPWHGGHIIIIMRTKDIIYRLFTCISLLFILFFIIIAFRDIFRASFELYPREYREAANLAIAKSFYEGINPYKINDGMPISVNVYGFINPLIASIISRIFSIGLLRSFYILSLMYTIIIPILISYEVYSIVGLTRKSWIFYPFLIFFSYTITYGTGHISSRPDYLGIIISLIIVMIIRRDISTRSILIASGLIILLFYIKPYFIFYMIPVGVFLLTKGKKPFAIYVSSIFLMGLVSFILIRWIFPLYYAETVYFEFVENIVSNSGVSTNANNFELLLYSMKQFDELLVTYIVPFIVLLIIIIGVVTKYIPSCQIRLFEDELMIKLKLYLLIIIWAIPILLILGRNKGAWVSYHMQLLMPAVIISSFVGTISLSKKRMYLEIAILCFLIFSTPTLYRRYGRVEMLNTEEIYAWDTIEDICVNATEKGKNIYASCLVNGLLFDRIEQFYTYYTGHNYYNLELEKQKESIENSVLLKKVLFPTFVNSIEYMNTLISEDTEKLKDNKYDIIISDAASSVEPGNIEEYNIMNFDLHSGVQNWETTVYIKKQQ